MKHTHPNEAAFARPYSEQQPGDRREFCYAQDGMTFREYLAAQALPGILVANVVSGVGMEEAREGYNRVLKPDEAARLAFEYADAMLLEAARPQRNRTPVRCEYDH